MVSEVRRSARLSALSNGFKPASGQSLGIQDSKKRKKTPKAAPIGDIPPSRTPPPPTPIKTLQAIGTQLGIAPSKLSRDQLMANPSTTSSPAVSS